MPAGSDQSRPFARGTGCALTLLASVCSAPLAHAQATPGSVDHVRAAASAIDGKAVVENAQTRHNWPSHRLDYAETRFSRLSAIDTGNVKDLGLVWSYDLASTRGVEATPLVVDGVMYMTASWS